MIGTFTYSGVHGPGMSLTGAVFANVQRVEFDYAHEVIRVTYDQPEKTVTLDLRASSTISSTVVAGQTVAVTVS